MNEQEAKRLAACYSDMILRLQYSHRRKMTEHGEKGWVSSYGK